MAEWTIDPWPWIEDTTYGEGGRDADHGLFHVTTRLDAVRESGGLKARRDLGGIVALGGGDDNRAPDRVSFTYDRSRALWLFGGIQATARAARYEIDPIEYVKIVFDWTGFPDDVWGEAISAYEERVVADAEERFGETENEDRWETVDGVPTQRLGGGSAVAWRLRNLDIDIHPICEALGLPLQAYRTESLHAYTRRQWMQMIDDNQGIIRHYLSDGARLYKFAQQFEAVCSSVEKYEPQYDDMAWCMPVIGFTAPYTQFAKIDPNQVAVLQCEARIGASVDFEPSECELRFYPRDVRVVRYGVEKEGAVPLPLDDEEAAE